jgi:hypothetical protein
MENNRAGNFVALLLVIGFFSFAATSNDRVGPLIAIVGLLIGLPLVVELLRGARGED